MTVRLHKSVFYRKSVPIFGDFRNLSGNLWVLLCFISGLHSVSDVYNAQVAAGINMMDTGVKTTSTLQIMPPGIPPPQAIAVDGI